MNRMPRVLILLAFLALLLAPPAAGQTPETADERDPGGPTLRVATKLAEPFVFVPGDGEDGTLVNPEARDPGSSAARAAKIDSGGSGSIDPGNLRGLSIDLWERLAERLDISFEYEVTTLEGMLEGVADGRYDLAISAITITPGREERLDLTHGYFRSGLGIAVPAAPGGGPRWVSAMKNLFTGEFLSAVGALGVLLLLVGVVAWLVEHRRNEAEFSKNPAKGIGDGFWFAAVTMTTVGYGDKSPKTVGGRVVSLVWMFASIIVISAFTGAIASSLTTASIDGSVKDAGDLASVRCGAVEGSAALASLRERGVYPRTFESVDGGLTAIGEGRIDAFVHDRPILRYKIRREGADARLLSTQFDVGSYGIALPTGSPLREPLNREILEITQNTGWDEVITRYLGGE